MKIISSFLKRIYIIEINIFKLCITQIIVEYLIIKNSRINIVVNMAFSTEKNYPCYNKTLAQMPNHYKIGILS